MNSAFVIVPVLSKAAILIFAKVSRQSPVLIKNPEVAALVRAQKVATGVDRIRPHGQPLTNTTSAKWNQWLRLSTFNRTGMTAKHAAITTTAEQTTKEKCDPDHDL